MQYNFTVRKKDKGYQIIVAYKTGRTWKQKSKQGFTTQREAKQYGQTILQEIKKNIASPLDETMSDITFIEFYKLYISEKHDLSANSILTYNNIIYKDCMELHNKAIKDITYKDVSTLLTSSNKSPASKNLCLILLKAIFKHAITPYKLLKENPCNTIKKFKKRHINEISTINHEDMDLLLFIIEDKYPYMYLACSIARYTGARYGEIIGLCWADVDFDNSTITINKQWARINDDVFGFKPPKSKNSIRTIPIPAILLDILKEYYTNDTERLIPFKTSKSAHINKIIGKIIPNKSIHSFRHTYATTLLAKGVDIRTVATLLGDNINTVINTYIHYSDEMRKRASQSIENIFSIQNF